MTELLTAAQMRAIEAAAIASGEVTGLELMERAGRGVVEAILEEWPELRATSHRAVVLCGPGNNGGDGFVVARLLKEWGWEVEVFLYGDPSRLPPDARVNYERWRGMGEITPASMIPEVRNQDVDIWVDALFGIGLARPLDAEAKLLLGATFQKWPVVAIDILSGIDADSGRWIKEPGESDAQRSCELTVTFHRAKVGHLIAAGLDSSEKLKVVDIGLPTLNRGRVSVLEYTNEIPRTLKDVLTTGLNGPGRLRKREGHKYSHGHALILSGPSGRGGAARLSARGALRIGAGVVTVGCPPDAIPENAARLDAVMLRGVADAAALAAVLEDGRINALCLGPGMGTGAREAGLVGVALGSQGTTRPTGTGAGGNTENVGRGVPRLSLVLDADALTLLSQNPDLFAALHPGCILTPHAGEFARLFPDIAAKLAEPATKGPAYSKVDATREAAKRAGCVVLYKGPDTVIADPTGRCAINSAHYDRAAPWLATAGSGDVLAGFITGLLARGFSPFDAACTGAWLHVECALSFGPGLIAEDLPEELPKVFRALGL
jgi:hydroxyethylthiazole kinase-like uncharacterized protein yjeF